MGTEHLSREEILQVYAAGPDAVVTLVERLVQRIAGLEAEVQQLAEQVHQLTTRLHQDSHNSGSPPSRDPEDQRSRRRRRARSLRPRTERLPGGQPGHDGHTLLLVAHPDQQVVHRPSHCARCQQPLAPHATAVAVCRRQVFDLPPLRLVVTEHQGETLACPACGHRTDAVFPADVRAPVQYGPHVRGFLTYLQAYQLLPLRRTCQLLQDLLGQPVSQAVVWSACDQAAARLAGSEARLKRHLRAAPVAHFDETGLYVAGRRQWVHTVSTPTATFYAVHPRRGQAALNALGILGRFRGVAVHDAYNAYRSYPCTHALCNVHHLRELTFQAEEEHEPWALPLKRLLEQMAAAVRTARAQGATALPDPLRRPLLHRYGRLLAWGLARHPPARPPHGRRGRPKQSKARNLLERLRDRRAEVLRFLSDFRVPFDNNPAERDLRMVKVQQKISGCFRTQAGATAFLRIRSYLSTAIKHGHNPYSALQQLFAGQPFEPT